MGLNLSTLGFRHVWTRLSKSFCKPRKRRARPIRIPIEDLEIRCFLSASSVMATIIQPDGKTVVVGSSEDLGNGNRDFAISRLNTDGSLDTTFNGGGTVLVPFNLLGTPGGDDVATSVALQQDGKIVVGGYAQATLNGDYDFALLRLNFDGSLDPTFGNSGQTTVGFQLGGSLNDRASGVAVTGDGKIVLGGTAERSSSGDTDFAIARFASNGTLDATFSGDGLKTIAFNNGGDKADTAHAIAVQPNGAIVIAGSAARSRSGDADFAVARVTAKGDMDKSFAGTGKRTVAVNLGGQKEDVATALTLQGTNIVLGGYAQVDGAGDYDFAVVRLQKNGNLDRTFGSKGKQTAGFDLGGVNQDLAFAIAPQTDGRLVVVGQVQLTDTGNSDFGVLRLTPNGSFDPAWGVDGRILVPVDLAGDGFDTARAVAFDPLTGKVTVAGTSRTDDFGNADVSIVRFTDIGLLDNVFAGDGLTNFNFGTPLPPL